MSMRLYEGTQSVYVPHGRIILCRKTVLGAVPVSSRRAPSTGVEGGRNGGGENGGGLLGGEPGGAGGEGTAL